MDTHGYPWTSMDVHGFPWISIGIHGYPWIGQMIPTGFGYGYSQSGMPPHSQPKEGGDYVRIIRTISKNNYWKVAAELVSDKEADGAQKHALNI